MGIKQKEENTNGGLHNTLAAGTTVKAWMEKSKEM